MGLNQLFKGSWNYLQPLSFKEELFQPNFVSEKNTLM